MKAQTYQNRNNITSPEMDKIPADDIILISKIRKIQPELNYAKQPGLFVNSISSFLFLGIYNAKGGITPGIINTVVLTQYSYYNLILLIALLVVLFFILRGRKIKQLYQKLKKELQERAERIDLQEKKIQAQKEEIDTQLLFSREQNNLIHQQTAELEKHRQHLEKTVGARTYELKIALEKAEEPDRLKTAFLENMSHEIRTPMNAIIGFASLLNQPQLAIEEREKFVSRITKNSHMLLRLIEDILDISKIHTEQMQINKSKFSVDKSLEKLYAIYTKEKTELELNKIDLILDNFGNDKEHFLFTDPYRFEQAMSNFLSNALKYTEKGTIRFGYKPVYSSEYEKEPSMLQFYVSDTGIGIAPQKTEYIFDLFSKIDDDSSKLYRGAGLGLYISKRLINLMGGQIGVQSKINEGSTFYFTLPYFDIGDLKQKESKKEKEKAKTFKSFDWRKKTILIAEDEKNNFIYLNEIIKRTGAQVIEAKNGLEAIEFVKNHPQINLILMDILMPELDGFDAARQIKLIRPGVPIIAQTAFTMHQKQKERSLKAGCDAYIYKPYEPSELLELISNFL
jgi:signal transduction histidine kinase